MRVVQPTRKATNQTVGRRQWAVNAFEVGSEAMEDSTQIVWTDTGIAGATADFWYEDTYLYEQECRHGAAALPCRRQAGLGSRVRPTGRLAV